MILNKNTYRKKKNMFCDDCRHFRHFFRHHIPQYLHSNLKKYYRYQCLVRKWNCRIINFNHTRQLKNKDNHYLHHHHHHRISHLSVLAKHKAQGKEVDEHSQTLCLAQPSLSRHKISKQIRRTNSSFCYRNKEKVNNRII